MKNKEGKKLTKLQLTGKILSWVFTILFGAFFVFISKIIYIITANIYKANRFVFIYK